jgi:signal transduction histidine kinase
VPRDDLVDVGLALLLAAVTVIEALRSPDESGPQWRTVVIGLLMVAPVAVRRRYPRGVFAVVVVLLVAQAALLGDVQGVSGYVALLLACYTLASQCPLPPALLGLALLVPALLYARWRDPAGAVGDFDDVAAVAAGCWVAGRVVWGRQQLIDQLSEQGSERHRRRTAEARMVEAEQRRRVARELHDAIAHQVNAMVAQAEIGQSAPGDPQRARQALRAVQETGVSTLAELRHLAGVLGEAASAGPRPRSGGLPAPRLCDAERLVHQLRAAGLDVTLRMDGQTADVPADVDLAAYRVLQEALTNTLRHAGPTQVAAHVWVSSGEVVVEVVDHGPVADPSRLRATAGAGQGLEAMRARLTLHGGDLESGPEDNGFRLRARIPVTRDR